MNRHLAAEPDALCLKQALNYDADELEREESSQCVEMGGDLSFAAYRLKVPKTAEADVQM